ncbi:ankyrin-3-like [Schistocerca americana]|uniref:ankyrin-3-like n=1 Tax=Schistocerca americana TaxID=7009 RepID=UPI001F502AC2|nr:ankyrin-3-like [Schistocerca americana]
MEAVKDIKETVAVDLGALLDAGDGAIVTLVAGSTRLVAHRAVLTARSPVFAAMFGHDTLEASSGQVAIPDVEGPVLRQLLAYLYTRQAPQLPGMAAQMLAAADKYGLPDLKADCERHVAAQLDVETAAATAVLAVRHSCPDLAATAVAFIRAHDYLVMATQGWADAVLHQPKDVLEVSRLLAQPPHSTRPATPTPTTAACHTPPPDADAVSSMGNLSAEEKSRRLIQAAEEGAVEELVALLAVGADVGSRGGEGETCLHRAARRGQVEAARRLLENGAEVDSRNSRQSTPLHSAAESGHAAVVRLLLSSAADPNARNQYERTPLHYAAEHGHTDVVRLLLTSSPYHNARNQNGWTPLHLAAYSGHTETAIVLLEAGADRGARNNSGNTPLDIARQNNRQQLIDLLR